MANRRVTRTGKSGGDITALCNSSSVWERVSKSRAIQDIESNTHTYYVHEVNPPVDVIVVTTSHGKHLRTTADSTSKNNLDNLPNC